jgi:hypothetical protein
LHFIQQTLLFPSTPPPAAALAPPPALSLCPPEEQHQQHEQFSTDEVILFSTVNEISIQNTTNHLEAIEKIWNAEKFCSGGLLRGRLARDQHPASPKMIVDAENGDRVLYPRSVGEVAGGSRRKTKKIKARHRSVARSLSPMESENQQSGDSTRHSKILFTEEQGGGGSVEKFSSVLTRIVENDRDKYS